MADMTWGLEYIWRVPPPVGGMILCSNCCELGTDKFVIVWLDQTVGPTQLWCWAVVGTVVGNVITWGAPVSFHNWGWSQANRIGVCKVDDDKFFVTFGDRGAGVPADIWGIVGDVVGDVITFGASVNISNSQGERQSCCALSDSKVAVTYNDKGAGDKSTTCICTIAGNIVTPGIPAIFYNAKSSPQYPAPVKVGTDKFVILYETIGGGPHGIVVTVTGTTPSFGTPVEIDTAMAFDMYGGYLGNNKLAIAWRAENVAVNMHGLSCILTISGTDIIIGALVEFQAAAGAGDGPVDTRIVALTPYHYLITWCENALGADPGRTNYCAVSGTTITLGAKETFHTPNGNPTTGLCLISDGNKVALGFLEGLGPDCKAIIGSSPLVAPAVTTDPATGVT